MDRYTVRSKVQYAGQKVPSVTRKTSSLYICTYSQLVKPAAMIVPGTPRQGQSAAEIPAAASQDVVNNVDTDMTDAGLPTHSACPLTEKD